jgi:transcriptional regulator with XRE-family HTH domain
MAKRRTNGSATVGIGRVLANTLELRGLKETELAEALDVSTNTVSNWVTGRYAPSHSNAARIASELKISLDELYGAAVPPATPAAPDGDAQGLVRQLAELQNAQQALRELSETVPPLLDILREAQRLAETWAEH